MIFMFTLNDNEKFLIKNIQSTIFCFLNFQNQMENKNSKSKEIITENDWNHPFNA